MIKKDFYSGLPVNEEPSNIVDVQVADKNEALKQFSVDPNQRMEQINMQQQQAKIPFIPYTSPQQPMYGGYVGNPVFAMGNNFFGNSPMPMFNQGFYGYQNQFNNSFPWMQQPRYQDQTVHVPGLNFGSDILLTPEDQEKCEQLQLDMMIEQEEAAAKRNERFQGYFNNNGYNYYGMPYYNAFPDVTVTRKYTEIINQMRQEAKDRRTEFNKNLSRMVHNYLGLDVSGEQLDAIYNGYDYTIPANDIQMQAECSRFSRMVPVSNQHIYANRYNDIKQFYDTINQDKNMNGFLQSLGVVHACDDMEQELHNRRDGSQLYSSDSYKRYLRKQIAERNGIKLAENNNNAANVIDANIFPTLGSSAKMLDDGSLSITAPSWIGGSMRRIQLSNELEQHFEENRRAFLNSIYSQEGSNGVN